MANKIGAAFKAVFSFLKKLVSRPGLQDFLQKYETVALGLIMHLAEVNNNAEFHVWKDEAFAEAKKATGELKDNWIAILIHLAFESYKAEKGK